MNTVELLLLYYNYSTIFTEPEENNCFSIITQVIIRATAFSFMLFVSSSETPRNCVAAILKISASVLHFLFFIRICFFPAQAEYSYFSADFRPKIFLYYS